MKNTSQNSTTRFGDVIRDTGHKLDEYGEVAGNKSDELIYRGKEYMHQVAEYIRKNPVKSSVMAGTLGFLLAKIIK